MALFLITGGCGFIGSHLATALLRRGDQVRVLDDLSTGSRANLLPGCALLEGDVADPALVRQAMEGVDGCFHLAAIASVELGMRDWLGTHRVNLGGTIAVLDAARAAKLPVVYASSAAVYGDQAVMPIAESAAARPLSSYGADKLGSEQHARVAGAAHGVPTCGLRFFNVFGPRQDPRSPYSGVISIFCGRMAAGQPVTIHGDGRQTRDFVHVGQVVRALLAGMEAASLEAPVFNVCTGRPTSVLELAHAVAAACGVAPDIRHGPGREGEIRESYGNPALAGERLGLGEAVALEDGLRDVVAWLRAGSPGAADGFSR